MPVDPLVPSKIREPVYGRKSPSRSAFSITEEDCQQSAGIHNAMSIILLRATRSFTLPPGLRYWERTEGLGQETTTLCGCSIAAQAHLSLSKNLDSQCIAERVDPDQRCVSLGTDRPVSLGRVDRVLCWTRTNQPRHSIQYLVTPQFNGGWAGLLRHVLISTFPVRRDDRRRCDGEREADEDAVEEMPRRGWRGQPRHGSGGNTR